MKIGFIGLGKMGAPMAANLAKAKHNVAGFDIARKGDVASATDAAKASEIIITMLPDDASQRDVYKEILPVAEKGACLVDCSTISVAGARAAHKAAAAAGLLSLDAPVSGGVAGARGATLTFMIGGTAEALAHAQPVFDAMGATSVHCGGAGAGQAAKICNNVSLAVSMLGVCEAFLLADRLGLDRAKMFEVVSASSGACWSLNTYCPAPGIGPQSPADNAYKPGFSSALMLKDLKLANATTPMGARATELYAAFVKEGGGDKDFSAMLPALATMQKET